MMNERQINNKTERVLDTFFKGYKHTKRITPFFYSRLVKQKLSDVL